MASVYRYEIDRRFLPILLPLGIRPRHDGIRLDDDGQLLATLGWFRLATEVANVAGAHITRDYRWWTAVGVRLSMADDGLTFGTNHRAGVCLHFKKRVPSILRPAGHSALTVTVADLDGLVAAVGRD